MENMQAARSLERSALVALLGRRGVKRHDVVTAIIERDDPAAAIEILQQHLRDTEGLFSEHSLDELLEATQRQIEIWESDGIGVHACFDDSYPLQLRDVREMPPVMFTRGTLAKDDRAIAVVGTRKASESGLSRAHHISRTLVSDGITVVSGLAEGVDTVAHQTALDSGGRTVAVIANGVDHCYPKSNQGLQGKIIEDGLVLSEYLPDTAPARWQFLERNAVMSGYSAATVVVEAGEKSGTRTQVQRALEHGRMVIFLDEVLTVSWARQAAERPGVRVARSLGELRDFVDEALGTHVVASEPPAVAFPALA
jgi:DNA processing protein